MNSKLLALNWKKFKGFTEAVRAYRGKSCVYVMADSNSKILRVGRARDGLYIRYKEGYSSTIDAAMYGSGNLVFVSYVPKGLCEDVEKLLIYREQPQYNKRGKKTKPAKYIRLSHSANAPAFRGTYD